MRRLMRWLGTLGLAAAGTAAFFLVLPLMQAITARAERELVLTTLDAASLPPPPPPPEIEEPEPEPEQQPPPELLEPAPLLDLAELELALDAGLGGSGWMAGDFAVKLDVLQANSEDLDALFSLADLDQKPRAVYQPSPAQDAKIRKRAPGTVYVIFVVDQRGRVTDPIVQKSTDPVFERAALAAVKQWRFEPGKRAGKPVRFRMRVPITFPKG